VENPPKGVQLFFNNLTPGKCFAQRSVPEIPFWGSEKEINLSIYMGFRLKNNGVNWYFKDSVQDNFFYSIYKYYVSQELISSS